MLYVRQYKVKNRNYTHVDTISDLTLNGVGSQNHNKIGKLLTTYIYSRQFYKNTGIFYHDKFSFFRREYIDSAMTITHI